MFIRITYNYRKQQTKKNYNFPEAPEVFVERLTFWTMNETQTFYNYT